MVVQRGDVFWAELGPATGSAPARRRPVVVIQRDAINQSRFNSVVVVPLTSQTQHAHLPGNVLLHKDEANLPRPSVVQGTHVTVVDKAHLREKIGTLSLERLEEIMDAVCWAIGRP
ncbi:type II toxin-antitoxin system PemK/MazF family toxin [Candidatus Entotheonella serta]|nr:type II toxin-antitoxin system PemK/MazF family toxin [Candidatus Entotheonella serta]